MPPVPSSPELPATPIIPPPPMNLTVEVPGVSITPLAPNPMTPQPNPMIPQANPVIPVAPQPPVPVTPSPPLLSIEPSGSAATLTFAQNGKYIVLKGKEGEGASDRKLIEEMMSCKLMKIEGISSIAGKNEVVVQQGAIARAIPKSLILFVGETREEVYGFMRDRVSQTDATARLAVARWCMFNGLREQALTEARAILKFQPQNKTVAELARSLEESLRQFPPEGAPTTTTSLAASQLSRPVAPAEGDLEITPEGATTFATRVQPILANLCVDCHARPDYMGSFKLTRVTGFEPGTQPTQANLRVTAKQLSKSDPANSPLLTKAIAVHGGLKQPVFVSRQIAGFRVLENWVLLAVGPVAPNTATGAGGMGPITQPQTASVQPILPTTPPTAGLPVPDGLPPVPATTSQSPSVVNVPVAPATPAVVVPPVLPTPPMLPATVPSQPPIIPPADAGPKPPAVPVIPPAVPLPPIPMGMKPGTTPAAGTQFGADILPKAANAPQAGDEFDPARFNQGSATTGKSK